MKFTVTLKDPDGFYESIKEAVDNSLNGTTLLDEDEFEELAEIRRVKINEAISKWVKYSEYITIEFDTTANTATVVPVK